MSRSAHVYQSKIKTENPFHKIIQNFPGLLVSSSLRVISCLSELNICIAGAKHDRSTMVNVEIWPEPPNVKSIPQWTEPLS